MSYSLPLLMRDLSKAQVALSEGRGLDNRYVISELNAQMSVDMPLILVDHRYIPVIEFEKVLAMISEYDIKMIPIQDDYVLLLNHLSFLYQQIQKRSPEPIESIETGFNTLKHKLLTEIGLSSSHVKVDKASKDYQTALSLSQRTDLDETVRIRYFKKIISDVMEGRGSSWGTVLPLIENNLAAQVQLINCYLEQMQCLFDKEDNALIFDLLEEMPKLLAVIKESVGEVGLQKIKDRILILTRPTYSIGDSCYLQLTTILSCEFNDFCFIQPREACKLSQHAVYSALSEKASAITSTEEFKTSLSPELLELPIPYSLKKFVASQGKKVEEQFLIFYRQFEKHNHTADVQHKREIYPFYSRASYGISVVMKLLDINILNEKMRHNNNAIERLIKHVPVFDEALYKSLLILHAEQTLEANDKSSLHKRESILGCICTLYRYLIQKQDESLLVDFEARIVDCYRNQTLEEIEQTLLNHQFDLILRELKLSRSFIPPDILDVFLNLEKLQLITEGLITLQRSPYRSLYIEQLKCELKGDDISRFIHDIAQANRMGKDIAQHNQHTKDLLRRRGLNPDSLFEYTKKMKYLYHASESDEVGEAPHLLYHAWLHLERLASRLSTLTSDDLKTQQLLNRFVQSVNAINVALSETETRHDYMSLLLRESVLIDIRKTYKLLGILKSKQSVMSDGLFDDIEQALQVYDEFKKLPASSRVKRMKARMMPYHFEVSLKDKAELDTLDLGDIMACCMAHTAESFESMVLTRVMDAMPIVVIKDKVTNKTAGLLWLYLAEKEDHALCLVGEYLETNTRYAKPQLMKAIHHSLLAFTHGIYEQLGQLDGFYLGKHFYGVTSGAVDHYPVEKLSLEEVVGGPLKAAEPAYEEPVNKRRLFTKDYSLLNFYSVDNTAHLFDKSIHDSESIPGLYELNDLLGSLSDRAIKEGHTTLEAIKSFIVSTAGFSIAPFFEASLLTDPAFEQVLKGILENAREHSEESARLSGDSETVSQARTGYRTESDHRRTGRYRFFIAALPSSDLPQPNVDVRETLQLLR